ncbi:MAG: DEAD/DEAH box helicase family protein [Devosia sp.]|nr:DEAD/DEAH box helicase family protein [Devosia sp.]
MGLPFDEDTYAAAKPYFQAGLAHVRQAGADIVDMMRALIAALRDQFGMDKDTIAAMKPYVLRYISDVQAGREAIEETNPQQPPKDKLQQQQAAESIKVIVGDKANIDATLPFLTEGQREDVLFAEKRWAAPDGYGVLFTNGTGTGKTFLALGAIKRLTKRGKGNGIVVVPNEAVMNEWVKSAPALGLQVKPLTDTKDAGSGIAITTYANFGQNDEIAKRDYDFVAIDEAHLLMLGKDAEPTKALDALRAVSLHPDGVLQRAEMQNRELVDRIRATSDQLKSLYRMMNNPDIMDQMYSAYRTEADGLEKKLAADRAKWEAALDAVESDVMARQGEKRSRVMFLSATPFAYEPSIQWGEGTCTSSRAGHRARIQPAERIPEVQ